jgi:putative hydrolase of the HAD superfamily
MNDPIRAVIFDFGGVVCFHPTKDQIAAAAGACGLDPADFVRALWKNRIVYDAGQDAHLYWRDVAATVGRVFDDQLIGQMIEREVDFWSRFDQRVLDWTGKLRENGVRTGILSNLPRPLGTRLRERGGLLEHFDHVTFSYELGVVKPQREIYDDSINGLGVAAAEALFLDDRPENVEGALAAGLKAELFVTWEQFAAEQLARYALPGE